MPVDSTHPQYSAALANWMKCRHAVCGGDAVKGAGECYLPKLDGMSMDDYADYTLRADFFNATGRTLQAFKGMLFFRDPTMEVPDALKPLLDDATLAGQSFHEYAKATASQIIEVGRAGTLIEWSEAEGRAYTVGYTAEQIVNWKQGRVNGRTVLTLLVLSEMVSAEDAPSADGSDTLDQTSSQAPARARGPGIVDHGKATGPASGKSAPDAFSAQLIQQYRVYWMDEGGVRVEIYQRPTEKDEWQVVKSLTPTRRGSALPEIPFVFHGPNNCQPGVDKPPLMDIVDINLSHYRNSADLEHGRHFTGLPTAYIAGFPKDTVCSIGSSVAWVSENPQAKAEFLEFTGQGLGALERALSSKEHQMAVLGARMLEAPKKEAETVEALTMKATGESATLAQIATSLSEQMTLVLQWALWWSSAADVKIQDTAGKATFECSRDFGITAMSAQMLTSMVAAAQSGYMSRTTVIESAKRGGLIPPERSVEDEIELITAEAPQATQGQPIEGDDE